MINFNILIIMNAINILPREIWFHILDYINDNNTFNQLQFVCQSFNQYYTKSSKIHVREIGNTLYIYKDIDIDEFKYTKKIGEIHIDERYNDSIVKSIQIHIRDINYELVKHTFYYRLYINLTDKKYDLLLDYYGVSINSINSINNINNSSIDELFERIRLIRKLIVNCHEDVFNIFRKRIMQYVELYDINNVKNYVFKN